MTENLRIVDDAVEAINAHDWDRLAKPIAESAVFYSPDSPEPLKGPSTLFERMRNLAVAFPDLRAEKVAVFGQGDWVCGEFVTSGTHEGPLQGAGRTIQPTNKSFRMRLCNVYRFEGGEIVEVRQYYDLLGMLAQLGIQSQSAPTEG